MRRAAAVLALALAGAGCNGSNAGSKATPTPTPASFTGAAELERARSLLAEGKPSAGAEALAEALRVVESAAPLRIASLTIAEDARGYGLYVPDADSVVERGTPVLFYFEPVGMTHGRQGDLWLLDMSADLTVLDAQGNVLQQLPDIVASRVTSRRPNREIQFVIRMQTIGMREGDFVGAITLKDRIGGETATEQVPFKIRIPK